MGVFTGWGLWLYWDGGCFCRVGRWRLRCVCDRVVVAGCGGGEGGGVGGGGGGDGGGGVGGGGAGRGAETVFFALGGGQPESAVPEGLLYVRLECCAVLCADESKRAGDRDGERGVV